MNNHLYSNEEEDKLKLAEYEKQARRGVSSPVLDRLNLMLFDREK